MSKRSPCQHALREWEVDFRRPLAGPWFGSLGSARRGVTMNRPVAAVLFILGSLVGGPVLFLAASIALVNVVRGLVLFLPAIFDLGDFRFLPHAIVAALAAGAMWLITQAMEWLGSRTVGVRGVRVMHQASDSGEVSIQPEDVSIPFDRARKWLIVLVTLLIVSVVFAVVVGIWVGRLPQNEMMLLVSQGFGDELLLVAVAMGIYMPVALATYAMARVGLELADHVAGSTGHGFFAAAWLGSGAVLVVWLILQWATGGIF